AGKCLWTGFAMGWRSSGHPGEFIRWRHRGFCQRLHADDRPGYSGLADYAPLRILAIRSSAKPPAGYACTCDRLPWRDLVGEKLDLVSGLISHLLEALYGVSGGFTLTDEFALAGTGLVNLTNNVAWAYLFLIVLTPIISYTLFFGRLGNLASLRFRFVGLSTLTRFGSRVVG